MLRNLSDLQPGDELIRMLGGQIKMPVIVGKVDEKYIYVGSKDGVIPWEHGWKFNIENGAEVDEDLGWDGVKITGSYLKFSEE